MNIAENTTKLFTLNTRLFGNVLLFPKVLMWTRENNNTYQLAIVDCCTNMA